MNTLEGEKVAVVGLAASGWAAAWLALEKGGEVHVSDLRTDTATHARGAELRGRGAEVELGKHPVDRIAGAGTVVVSPGIRPDAPVLNELGERGVRWISEPEFAFRFFDGPLIAVTGTNGKTTTAALVAHLLEEDGLDVALGGNIGAAFGPPASELALRERSPAWYVLEMSSFQLGAIDRFKPDIGVMTNLAPDHLDWYPSVESYYADKANLFRNADDDSRWVLNGDDPAVAALAEGVPGRRFFFSRTSGGRPGAYLDRNMLTLDVSGEVEALGHVEDIALVGGAQCGKRSRRSDHGSAGWRLPGIHSTGFGHGQGPSSSHREGGRSEGCPVGERFEGNERGRSSVRHWQPRGGAACSARWQGQGRGLLEAGSRALKG